MSHSLTFLKNHIIFSTKYRVEWITDNAAPRLYAYMAEVAKSKKAYAIEIGGIEDHVHILANFHASRSVASVVGAIKSNSSRLAKELLDNEDFGWQAGYAGFSVSESEVGRVRRYIRNQRDHHRRMTYEDEIRRICQRYGVKPDETFLKGYPGDEDSDSNRRAASQIRSPEGGSD